MFKFSTLSLKMLEGVHIDLVKVTALALRYTPVEFGVIHGLRTIAAEQQAVATGHSQTMHSMHLPQPDGFAHAIDIAAYVNGHIVWDPAPYQQIRPAFTRAGKELNIALVWGGDWHSLKDWGHYELDQKVYNI